MFLRIKVYIFDCILIYLCRAIKYGFFNFAATAICGIGVSVSSDLDMDFAGENLTEEQLAILKELGYGDTEEENSESSETPDVGGKEEEAESGKTEEAETENADPVILAKDGRHTIPYEKLVEEREVAKRYRAEAEELRRQLEEKAAAAKSETDSPNTKDTDDTVDFGDFSEEELRNGIDKLVEKRVNELVESRLKEALTPLQQKQHEEQVRAHFDEIYSKHPDADSIVESKELADWLQGQPSYVRDSVGRVLESGTSAQVVEVLDTFKAATAPKGEAAQSTKAANKGQAAVPDTLSGIPGGKTPSAGGSLDGLSALEMAERFAGMSAEEIQRYLNS